ncbi:NUDIX domain-containing protein [Catellatospora sp. NPDC049111]|uniref:NUDIX domain-containing protein n=1 Tax=Catellatospora sp. NPDC049111 TaxID=3155271 RepID=UPI0033DA2520
MSPLVFRLFHRVRGFYWRVAKPTTYGVKVLIVHAADAERVLLVRHSYGDRSLWSLPGGGYRPARETPEQAARRECVEELGVELDPSALVLAEHLTANGGRQGHLKIVRVYTSSDGIRPNGEISEARWTTLDLADLPDDPPVSKWVHSALKAHAQARHDGGM